MTRRTILPIAILTVVILVGVFALVEAGSPDDANARIDGQVYVLPKDFLINLDDARFAKLSLGLVLSPSQKLDGAVQSGDSPDAGQYGPLEQEPVVRDIVTDTLTGKSADALITHAGRERVKRTLLDAIRRQTDVQVRKVLLMDVAVQ